ncbi:MAG: EAL domain-containing protein [Pseudomonadales bacterium]
MRSELFLYMVLFLATAILVRRQFKQFFSIVYLILALICGWFIPSVEAMASPDVSWLTVDERSWIEKHPVIRIGIDTNYPPYEIVNNFGEMEGISADYLQLISEATGLKFKLVPGLNWGDVVTRLRRHQLDMSPVMTITKDRQKSMLFTLPYLDNPYVIVTRNDGLDFDSEMDLKGERIALVRAYASTELVLESVPGVVPIFFNSELNSLKAVASGKAVATIGRLGGVAHQIQSHNLGNLKIAAMTSFPAPGLSMAIRNDWPELRNILEKALQNIGNNQRNEIAQRWIKVKQDVSIDLLLISQITGVSLAFIISLFLWNRKLKGTVNIRGGQLKREHTLRQESENRFATLFENATEAIAVIDVETGFFYETNANAASLFGLSKEELSGRSIWYLCPSFQPEGQDSKDWLKEQFSRVMNEKCPMFEWVYKTLEGDERPCEMRLVGLSLPSANGQHVRCSMIDVYEKKRSEERVYRLAHYDSLTGLPNRTYLSGCLEKAISLCHGTDTKLAVLTLDLDHFRNINDSLGHLVGDAILEEVARRFEEILRKKDILARIGGDEFVVLLEDLDAQGYAAHVAANLLGSLVPSFWVDGMKLNISASIGISLCCEESDDADDDPVTLIKNSESAMYKAKETGRNKYEFYTPELTVIALERITLGIELRRAIEEKKELEVWYQPQFSLKTGDIFGAEALVRWRHPEAGLIPPDKFIPIAEEQGLINALGQQVLQQACKDMSNWLKQGINLDVVAVNVSGHQVQSADFETIIYDTLSEEGLDPQHLQLEITESVVMGRAEYTIELMERLKMLGITIAIDDFGTGYSSLSYLKRLPVNKLKIDRSFVTGLPSDNNDRAIVKAIIALSENLNLDVIAEGIETIAQQQFLEKAGCHQGQGYLKGKPTPADQFERLVTSHRSDRQRA